MIAREIGGKYRLVELRFKEMLVNWFALSALSGIGGALDSRRSPLASKGDYPSIIFKKPVLDQLISDSICIGGTQSMPAVPEYISLNVLCRPDGRFCTSFRAFKVTDKTRQTTCQIDGKDFP